MLNHALNMFVARHSTSRNDIVLTPAPDKETHHYTACQCGDVVVHSAGSFGQVQPLFTVFDERRDRGAHVAWHLGFVSFHLEFFFSNYFSCKSLYDTSADSPFLTKHCYSVPMRLSVSSSS